MTRRRTASTAVIALVATATLAAQPATAAPAGDVFGDVFEMACDEPVGTVDATINPGQGIWTPAFVVGSTQRLVPYAFDVTVDGTDIGIEVGKTPPRHGRTVDCTFTAGFGGVSGTVSVAHTPTR